MQNVKIVTDSTAYLSDEIIKKHNIVVVPLSVNFENENFKENEKTREEFFTKLKSSKTFPTTSQPSIGDFYQTYQGLLENYNEIVSIHISEELSGTIKSAEAAAQQLNQSRIKIFNSTTTAIALEFMVLEAAHMAEQGKSSMEIIDRISYIRDNFQLLFIVDNLEYLKRGGRIGKASALLGTILKIKPILYVKGQVGIFDKVRTSKKALQRIIEELEKTINEEGGPEKIKAGVVEVSNKDGLAELYNIIKKSWPNLEISKASCGPVIGSHVGAGALGLAFYKK
ncbi:MAG: DegV family protein [Bacillota bacterium]